MISVDTTPVNSGRQEEDKAGFGGTEADAFVPQANRAAPLRGRGCCLPAPGR